MGLYFCANRSVKGLYFFTKGLYGNFVTLFWLFSILVVFHFGCLPFGRVPFWSSSILVVFYFGHLPFWSNIFPYNTLIPRPALMYSQFTAMLVKTIGKVVFLFGRGQFTNQDSYSVALLLLTVSYLRVKKLLPLTLQLINTLEISIKKGSKQERK